VVGVVLNRVRFGGKRRKRSYDYGVRAEAINGQEFPLSRSPATEMTVHPKTPARPTAPKPKSPPQRSPR
jgi:hypothetical protein